MREVPIGHSGTSVDWLCRVIRKPWAADDRPGGPGGPGSPSGPGGPGKPCWPEALSEWWVQINVWSKYSLNSYRVELSRTIFHECHVVYIISRYIITLIQANNCNLAVFLTLGNKTQFTPDVWLRKVWSVQLQISDQNHFTLNTLILYKQFMNSGVWYKDANMMLKDQLSIFTTEHNYSQVTDS